MQILQIAAFAAEERGAAHQHVALLVDQHPVPAPLVDPEFGSAGHHILQTTEPEVYPARATWTERLEAAGD